MPDYIMTLTEVSSITVTAKDAKAAGTAIANGGGVVASHEIVSMPILLAKPKKTHLLAPSQMPRTAPAQPATEAVVPSAPVMTPAPAKA